jgi:Rrf2 family cysteine metabolism transcriptional repressor
MRVSSRGQYGLRAMTYLATRHGEGPIRVRTVAEAESLPAKYLEQLLARLRQAGLVRSCRGARGGIMLARAPETITAREVISTLEGSLAPVECVENRNRHAEECVTHPLWSALHNSVLTTLESFTLADLAARSRNGKGGSVKPADRPETAEAVAGSGVGRTDAGN